MIRKSLFARRLTLALLGLTTTVHAQPITVVDVNGSQFSVRRSAAASARPAATPVGAAAAPGSPPVITQQPRDQTVAAGSPATFTVSATGDYPLTYQWYRNWTMVNGATQTAFTIAAPSAADNGDPVVVLVTDVFCATTLSQTAVLHVSGTPPTITLTKSASPTFVGHGGTVTFTITYTNTSTVTAARVTITDGVPAGATLVPGSITNGGSLSGNTITWTLGTVAANASGNVSFQVTAN